MEQLSDFVANNMILVIAFFAVLGLLIANLLSGVGAITIQDAVQKINRENAVVLDVRTKDVFDQGHVVGALNFPEKELDNELKNLGKFRDKKILVFCEMGGVSSRVVRKLQKQGFVDVSPVKGGLSSWRQENLPVRSIKENQ